MNEQTAKLLARDISILERSSQGCTPIEDLMKLFERYRLVKKDVMRNYRCDGQLSITDFPQYLPETEAEEYGR